MSFLFIYTQRRLQATLPLLLLYNCAIPVLRRRLQRSMRAQKVKPEPLKWPQKQLSLSPWRSATLMSRILDSKQVHFLKESDTRGLLRRKNADKFQITKGEI
jgi:hypothetical protein